MQAARERVNEPRQADGGAWGGESPMRRREGAPTIRATAQRRHEAGRPGRRPMSPAPESATPPPAAEPPAVPGAPEAIAPEIDAAQPPVAAKTDAEQDAVAAADAGAAEAAPGDLEPPSANDGAAGPTGDALDAPDARPGAATRVVARLKRVARARPLLAIVAAATRLTAAARRRLRRAPEDGQDAERLTVVELTSEVPPAEASAEAPATAASEESAEPPAAEPEAEGAQPEGTKTKGGGEGTAAGEATKPPLSEDPRVRLGIAALVGAVVVVALALASGKLEQPATDAEREAVHAAAFEEGAASREEDVSEARRAGVAEGRVQGAAEQAKTSYRNGYFDGQDCALIDGATGGCVSRAEILDRLEANYQAGWEAALAAAAGADGVGVSLDLTGD